jgi:hypothetical protein
MPSCVSSQSFQLFDPGPSEWRCFLMLHGFFDDSGKGSNSDNRVVCLAGYVAGDNAIWTGLHGMWRHFLFQHNLEWLHMKDFMAEQSSEYAHLEKFDWDAKRKMLEDFSSAIKMSHL